MSPQILTPGLLSRAAVWIGAYDVRLIEVSAAMTAPATPPLWVELYNRRAGRAINSAGCRDLLVAGAATERS